MLFGVTNKYFHVGEFTGMESLRNENRLCVCARACVEMYWCSVVGLWLTFSVCFSVIKEAIFGIKSSVPITVVMLRRQLEKINPFLPTSPTKEYPMCHLTYLIYYHVSYFISIHIVRAVYLHIFVCMKKML